MDGTSAMLAIGSALALLLAAGTLYQFIGARRAARTHAAPGRLIAVHGQRLHVVSAGHGWPTVLLESAVAASSLSWTRVLGDVAA